MEPELIGQFDPAWLVTLMSPSFFLRHRAAPLDRIRDVVRLEFRLPANTDFSKKDNRAHICAGRHVAIYLVWALCGWSFPRIGMSFKRDHSTVIHPCNIVARRMRQNPQFARMVERLMEQCR